MPSKYPHRRRENAPTQGTPLEVGDVILNAFGGGRRYIVTGFSEHGKTIYRRESGLLDTTWVRTRENLPKNWKVVGRVNEQ